ncbi:Short-chain_dehydrogenase/reductase [Hexamita inflata]|uniref:Short-chain dehydrogenase/reductase n=1 Tax=Hexamita inflata TaxID=28002 RepID=A0AA86TLL1_9EUKA|nr:Short-chain dehydrogenase/reductase [Hexamita inflata]
MKYGVLILALIAIYIVYINIPNIKQYQSNYAVVTGATGGIGQEIVKKLITSQNVIAISENLDNLSKLQQKYQKSEYQVLIFQYDLSNTKTFIQQFDEFLLQNSIDKRLIGMFFSNAGFGNFKPFHSYSFHQLQQFVSVNMYSHIILTAYFQELFSVHRSTRKSAIILTSSILSHTCGSHFSLYHICKSTISYFGSSIKNENKNIHVLTVHPSPVKQTEFYKNNGMQNLQNIKVPLMRNMEKSWFAITPKKVVNVMISRIGKVGSTNIGIASIIADYGKLVGRNIQGYIWSFMWWVGQAFQ